MKSIQLLQLQQQFLRSLHVAPSPWLLAQIQPARGFSGPDDALAVYLQRAVKRTVDPLRSLYAHLFWLIGEQSFEKLIAGFYQASLGEPLEAAQMATEFVSYFSSLLEDDQLDALLQDGPLAGVAAITRHQILVAVAMLDWRLQWVTVSPRRASRGVAALMHELHHRNHLAARPRLDFGSRLLASKLDLQWVLRAAAQQAEPAMPMLFETPQQYVLYLAADDQPTVIPIEGLRFRLLSRCDGTHTLFSLIYEQSLYGVAHDAVISEIQSLIQAGLIVDLQYGLVES